MPSLPGHSPPIGAVSGSWEGTTCPQSPPGCIPCFSSPQHTSHVQSFHLPAPSLLSCQKGPQRDQPSTRTSSAHRKAAPRGDHRATPGRGGSQRAPRWFCFLVPKTTSHHAAYTELTNLIKSREFQPQHMSAEDPKYLRGTFRTSDGQKPASVP